MILNRENLEKIETSVALQKPEPEMLRLPEKVLQFGTGVLLRGLPDYFIDKANREGIFNGRVVVVKSTDKGGTVEFDDQDGLYTICVRGIEDGQKVEENIISGAISRVLTASSDWSEILQLAANPEIEIILSNTTEVGIQLVDDNIMLAPPVSFPGKLLAVLLARYRAFNGDKNKGLVIVPTELIPDNGLKLKNIVKELATRHHLDADFLQWLEESNTFCNTLVDRIVPGKPDAQTLARLEQELGYHDELLTMSEVYRLWAIEGDERVKQVLSFAEADKGVIITPDINIHRELKLRLLNGTHTLSCGVAVLAGIKTVKEAMDNTQMANFISALMQEDIAPAIPYPVAPEASANFARKVLDRFRNPHIEHQWLSITMNYTAKLKMRLIPVLLRYYETASQAPENIAFGFAAYLLFMRATENRSGKYFGTLNNEPYLINDESAEYFYGVWQRLEGEELVDEVLRNQELWGTDLTALPGFAAAVKKQMESIKNAGISEGLKKLEGKQVSA
ncbi:altronate oxidoreductase [Adhaeribacter aerolatus]|uniref:Altronate oxidoreductase n=1 Tax=Adhaeribacter aerolatus TaxID=670289 RepID=A0A512AVU9_9BACT|nr:tagaturonate reductase [Adhaeribacter aerolatus]GEO03842.1 altronate oxidoreductase [Adhaeribacter aerolatus]